MAQTVLRRSINNAAELPRSLREWHAQFLGRHRDILVTYGPIYQPDGAPVGYLYQTDLPGSGAAAVAGFLAEDPFAAAGVYQSTMVSDWHCALAHRLPTLPERPGMQGFFFHGIGKPDITDFRNTIVEAHRAHLQRKDGSNCVSRGFLTDAGGKNWLGSAMVYEFPDRAALDAFFRDEPYCVNGIYQHIDIYRWTRGAMA